jgi:hypothetical protein
LNFETFKKRILFEFCLIKFKGDIVMTSRSTVLTLIIVLCLMLHPGLVAAQDQQAPQQDQNPAQAQVANPQQQAQPNQTLEASLAAILRVLTEILNRLTTAQAPAAPQAAQPTAAQAAPNQAAQPTAAQAAPNPTAQPAAAQAAQNFAAPPAAQANGAAPAQIQPAVAALPPTVANNNNLAVANPLTNVQGNQPLNNTNQMEMDEDGISLVNALNRPNEQEQMAAVAEEQNQSVWMPEEGFDGSNEYSDGQMQGNDYSEGQYTEDEYAGEYGNDYSDGQYDEYDSGGGEYEDYDSYGDQHDDYGSSEGQQDWSTDAGYDSGDSSGEGEI